MVRNHCAKDGIPEWQISSIYENGVCLGSWRCYTENRGSKLIRKRSSEIEHTHFRVQARTFNEFLSVFSCVGHGSFPFAGLLNLFFSNSSRRANSADFLSSRETT